MSLLQTHLRPHRAAGLIALSFILLTSVYNIITPPFEMSDETRHYAVVKYMADTARLPVQEPSEAQIHWSHEGNQPPLYYALVAGLTAWIDTGTWDDVYWYNPHTSAGVPLRTDNENMTIHTEREAFPWQGYTLAVRLGRFVSSAMAVVSVIFTYLIGLRLFQGDKRFALLVMALTAFTPMFVFIASAVNNDNAVILFCTLATWLMIVMLQEGTTWKRLVWLALFIGLGSLSKLYAVGMIPLAGLLLLWQGWQSRNWSRFIKQAAAFGAIVFAMAGWFYLRNYWLYGDLLALDLMRDVAGRRDTPLTLRIFLAEFEGFRIAYWALFGGVNVIAHNWIYQVLDWFTAVGVLGVLALLGWWGWQKRWPCPERINMAAFLVLLGWFGVMVGGFIVWNFNLTASQGRLFYPAIAAISGLAVVGLSWWLPQRYQLWPSAVLAGGLLVFAVLSPWLYIAPAYAQPALLTEADIPSDLTRLNYTFNEQIELVGVRLPTQVRPAEVLPVTVYWRVLEPMAVNYSVFVQLFGRGEQAVGQFDTYPGLGAWPTTLLAPGDVLADTYPVEVNSQAEWTAPARLRVAVGLYEYDQPGFPRPPIRNSAGELLESTFIGEVKLARWQAPTVEPETPLEVQFEDGIALAGYDSTCPGDGLTCTLTLHWRPQSQPSADYQVFIQLWRGEAQLAGFDGPPLGDDYPTSFWASGEVLTDPHPIALPADLPPGDYRFRLGLYRADTGQRLPAFTPAGPLLDFAVEVPLEIP